MTLKVTKSCDHGCEVTRQVVTHFFVTNGDYFLPPVQIHKNKYTLVKVTCLLILFKKIR